MGKKRALDGSCASRLKEEKGKSHVGKQSKGGVAEGAGGDAATASRADKVTQVAKRPRKGRQEGVGDDLEKRQKINEEEEDLDGLFGKLKKGSMLPPAAEGNEKGAKVEKKEKKVKVVGSKDDIFGVDEGKGRKKTEEGFLIYSEEELGLGKSGGDTDLCPFDCECCY